MHFKEQNDKLFGMKIVDCGGSEEFKSWANCLSRELRENSRLKEKDLKIVEARDTVAAVASPVYKELQEHHYKLILGFLQLLSNRQLKY